jgi:MFS family permease
MKADAMTSTPHAGAPMRSRVAAVLQRSIFLISLPFGILDFVLPIYGKRIGADALQIGLFFSAFSLMVVVLRPLVGTALDHYGRRPFFLAGLLGYALTMTTFALADSVVLIVLARMVQGVASACLWLAAQSITADVAENHQRGSSFGGIAESSSRGSIIGVFIGFAVLFASDLLTGWKLLFGGYAVVGLAAFGFAAIRLRETNPRAPRSEKPQPIRWTRAWTVTLLGTAVTGASWAMLAPVLMIFLQEKFTAEINELALAFLPSGLVWAFLPSQLGRLADRFGRKPLMVLGMVAAALTCFLIPVVGSLTALAVLWAVQALSAAAGDPAEQAMVADLTGGDQRGQAYGLYTMAAGLGATVGPLAGGWLYQTVGQTAPFYAGGLTLAAAALLMQWLLQEPARREPLTIGD